MADRGQESSARIFAGSIFLGGDYTPQVLDNRVSRVSLWQGWGGGSVATPMRGPNLTFKSWCGSCVCHLRAEEGETGGSRRAPDSYANWYTPGHG